VICKGNLSLVEGLVRVDVRIDGVTVCTSLLELELATEADRYRAHICGIKVTDYA
jgi:hypothetical protein